MAGHDNRPPAILVVEDEFMIAMDLRSLLEAEGFAVIGPVASIERALEILNQTTPDACVLDVNLRGENSGPVAAILRAKNIPFVLSSAYEQRDLDRFGTFEGVQNVGKPVDPNILTTALEQLLS